MKSIKFVESINKMDMSDECKADVIKYFLECEKEENIASVHETEETKRFHDQKEVDHYKVCEEEHTKQMDNLSKYVDPLAKLAYVGLELLKQKK